MTSIGNRYQGQGQSLRKRILDTLVYASLFYCQAQYEWVGNVIAGIVYTLVKTLFINCMKC